MKNSFIFAAATMVASLLSAPASAVVLDFVAEAAGAERAIENGSTISNFQGTGVDVTFTSGSGDWYPYFDDLSEGRPAGLGVCKELFGSVGGPGDDGLSDDCNPPEDDNVSVGEFITLTFGGDEFHVRNMSFYDADHFALGVGGNDGMLAIMLNGGPAMVMSFSTAISMAMAGAYVGATSITWAYVDTYFYIAEISDVPIPGAIPLLLSGLAGIGFVSRKKKVA